MRRQQDGPINTVMPLTAVLIVAGAFAPYSLQVTAGLLVRLSIARSSSHSPVHAQRPAGVSG